MKEQFINQATEFVHTVENNWLRTRLDDLEMLKKRAESQHATQIAINEYVSAYEALQEEVERLRAPMYVKSYKRS